MASSSSGSRDGSQGGSRDVVVGGVDSTVAPAPARNTTGDTCGYYHLEGSQTCRQPRSCYDCLNVALPTASEGCVLNPSGVCLPLSAYVPSLDFRANHNNSPVAVAYNNFFPSINSTYCEATDPACARCEMVASSLLDTGSTQILLGMWNGSREVPQRFCVGSEGCVCLAACMPAKWKNNVEEDCSNANANYNSTASPSYPTTDNYRSTLPIFMVMQLVLIAMVIHRQKLYANRFRRRPAPPVGPYNNVQAIREPANRLQLTGWRSLQAEMVQREKAQRGLVSLMSPRTGGDADPPTSAQQEHDGEHDPHQQRPTPQHNYIIYDPNDDDDDDIPELPVGTPITPAHGATRRRGSTDASLAMLEDGRASDIGQRPNAVSISEDREVRSL